MKTYILVVLIPLAIVVGFIFGQSSVEPNLGGDIDTKGQDIKIQVPIQEPNFHDALYFTLEEWALITEEEINTETQKRYDDWVIFKIEQSKIVPKEPTTEELEARKTELENELDAINSQLGYEIP